MKKLEFIQIYLIKAFASLARCTVKYPRSFVIVPTVLSLCFLPGAIFMNFELDFENSFTPIAGRTIGERIIAQDLFPLNYSAHFNPARQINLKGYGRLIIRADDGGSVLRKNIFDTVLRVNNRVKSISVTQDDLEWKYQDICARNEGICWQPLLLEIESHIDDINNGIYDVKYPLNNISSTEYEMYAMALGGVTQNEKGHIVEAKAAALEYFLDASNPYFERIINTWEEEFLQIFQKSVFENITIYRFNSKTMNTELGNNTFSSMKYFSLTIIIMIFFGLFTNMMIDCVKSKPWFALLACISTILAGGFSFGLLLYCGYQFSSITLILPFLMLGIGMDDSYVILSAWRATDKLTTLEERMVESYRRACIPITLTSVTNIAAFFVGTFSPFRSTTILCVYATLYITMTFIYQITFFGGCMAILGAAEQNNLHSITFQKVTPRSSSEHDGKLYLLCCSGGNDPNDSKCEDHKKEHSGMVFFRDVIGEFLSHFYVKCWILLTYAVYLFFAIDGCTKVKEGYDLYQLYQYDNYASMYAKQDMDYFYNYLMRYQVIIDRPIIYSDPETQRNLLKMLLELESLPFAAEKFLNYFWLDAYLKFLDLKETSLLRSSYNLTNEEEFIQCLKTHFLKHPLAKDFENDINFNENSTRIMSSRFFYQIKGMVNFLTCKEATIKIWSISEHFPIKIFFYHPLMQILEAFIGMMEYSVQAIGVTAIVIMAICYLMIPNVTHALCMSFTILSIEIGILGFMAFWGVNLNIPSLISIIISVGITVDNTSHITFAFMNSKMEKGDDKMKEALYFVGVPIFQGCISTMIGVAVLPLTPNYGFHVFFKVMFLLMSFSLYHSIIIVPMLLSLIHSISISFKKFKTMLKILNR